MNMGIIAGSRLRSAVVSSKFIIEVDSTKSGVTNNNRFQFTGALGDYDVVAKQGGSVVQTFTNLSNQQNITFSNGPGVYVLEVTAKATNGFTGMRFNDSGDKLKLSKVNQWGVFNDNRSAIFRGCSNLNQIGVDNNWLNSITDGNSIFRDCGITSLPNTLTLNNLINGGILFFNNSLTSLPSGMTLDNLEGANSIFQGNSLTSLPSGMTLNNLENSFGLFADNSLTSLPSGMTLNNSENGSRTFRNNPLTSLPSGMTLENLNNGYQIFLGATLSTARYSQLLEDMQNLNSNSNVSFNGGNSKYNTTGETARDLLTTNQSWSFRDGGLE